MKRICSKGFTLIEMAIVIVIIAILSTIAIPRFSGATRSADATTAKDVVIQLTTAANIFKNEQQREPFGFQDFVTNNGAAISPLTMSLAGVGDEAGPPCIIHPSTIFCTGGIQNSRFPNLAGDVTYTFNQGAGTFTINCQRMPDPQNCSSQPAPAAAP